ncbi:MAG: glycoside hydrolase family 57 protein [Euryarchaeota archaeon]|nr:glycoside hydrolase family 57 protein [Euryarchaeota archaeon]
MTKKSICLAFEVHQPFRLRKDFYWNKQMFKRSVKVEDIFDYYFFADKDREVFEKVARKCYRPTNEMILRLIDEYDNFKVAYSVSGVFVEQCERYGSGKAILEDFRQLASSGKVEFLDQTYYHSLVGLYEEEGEFIEQVRMHRELMRDLIGYEPVFFENTELLYNNRIARLTEEMGYRGILAEGVERVLNGKSPNYVYMPVGCKNLKVLLRDYPLTDDVGFRFSLKSWKEYPLSASKYASWLNATPGQCINIFLDYETFGEHHWEDTGIFEFLRDLPSAVLNCEMEFSTPSEIIEKYSPIGVIDVRNLETTSWADVEKDTSCFIGNTMQWACYEYLRWLEPYVKESEDEELLKIWRYLGISDHLYYMFTVGGASGDVHSYFSHFEKPYDAFVTFLSVIHDFDVRLRAKIKEADYPFVFRNGEKVRSLKGLCNYIKRMPGEEAETVIKECIERGDFERWIRESVGEEEIAEEVGNLRLSLEQQKYDADELRDRLCECVCN